MNNVGAPKALNSIATKIEENTTPVLPASTTSLSAAATTTTRTSKFHENTESNNGAATSTVTPTTPTATTTAITTKTTAITDTKAMDAMADPTATKIEQQLPQQQKPTEHQQQKQQEHQQPEQSQQQQQLQQPQQQLKQKQQQPQQQLKQKQQQPQQQLKQKQQQQQTQQQQQQQEHTGSLAEGDNWELNGLELCRTCGKPSDTLYDLFENAFEQEEEEEEDDEAATQDAADPKDITTDYENVIVNIAKSDGSGIVTTDGTNDVDVDVDVADARNVHKNRTVGGCAPFDGGASMTIGAVHMPPKRPRDGHATTINSNHKSANTPKSCYRSIAASIVSATTANSNVTQLQKSPLGAIPTVTDDDGIEATDAATCLINDPVIGAPPNMTANPAVTHGHSNQRQLGTQPRPKLTNESQSEQDSMQDIIQEMQIWNLRIKPNDGLPQRICRKCSAQFYIVSKFRRKCLKVQIRLRGLHHEHLAQKQQLDSETTVVAANSNALPSISAVPPVLDISNDLINDNYGQPLSEVELFETPTTWNAANTSLLDKSDTSPILTSATEDIEMAHAKSAGVVGCDALTTVQTIDLTHGDLNMDTGSIDEETLLATHVIFKSSKCNEMANIAATPMTTAPEKIMQSEDEQSLDKTIESNEDGAKEAVNKASTNEISQTNNKTAVLEYESAKCSTTAEAATQLLNSECILVGEETIMKGCSNDADVVMKAAAAATFPAPSILSHNVDALSNMDTTPLTTKPQIAKETAAATEDKNLAVDAPQTSTAATPKSIKTVPAEQLAEELEVSSCSAQSTNEQSQVRNAKLADADAADHDHDNDKVAVCNTMAATANSAELTRVSADVDADMLTASKELLNSRKSENDILCEEYSQSSNSSVSSSQSSARGISFITKAALKAYISSPNCRAKRLLKHQLRRTLHSKKQLLTSTPTPTSSSTAVVETSPLRTDTTMQCSTSDAAHSPKSNSSTSNSHVTNYARFSTAVADRRGRKVKWRTRGRLQRYDKRKRVVSVPAAAVAAVTVATEPIQLPTCRVRLRRLQLDAWHSESVACAPSPQHGAADAAPSNSSNSKCELAFSTSNDKVDDNCRMEAAINDSNRAGTSVSFNDAETHRNVDSTNSNVSTKRRHSYERERSLSENRGSPWRTKAERKESTTPDEKRLRCYDSSGADNTNTAHSTNSKRIVEATTVMTPDSKTDNTTEPSNTERRSKRLKKRRKFEDEQDSAGAAKVMPIILKIGRQVTDEVKGNNSARYHVVNDTQTNDNRQRRSERKRPGRPRKEQPNTAIKSNTEPDQTNPITINNFNSSDSIGSQRLTPNNESNCPEKSAAISKENCDNMIPTSTTMKISPPRHNDTEQTEVPSEASSNETQSGVYLVRIPLSALPEEFRRKHLERRGSTATISPITVGVQRCVNPSNANIQNDSTSSATNNQTLVISNVSMQSTLSPAAMERTEASDKVLLQSTASSESTYSAAQSSSSGKRNEDACTGNSSIDDENEQQQNDAQSSCSLNSSAEQSEVLSFNHATDPIEQQNTQTDSPNDVIAPLQSSIHSHTTSAESSIEVMRAELDASTPLEKSTIIGSESALDKASVAQFPSALEYEPCIASSKIQDFITEFHIDTSELDEEQQQESPQTDTYSPMAATSPMCAYPEITASVLPQQQQDQPHKPPLLSESNLSEMQDVETTLSGILNEMQDQHIYTPVSSHTDDFFNQSVYSPLSDPPDTPTHSLYAESPIGAGSISAGSGGGSVVGAGNLSVASSPYVQPMSIESVAGSSHMSEPPIMGSNSSNDAYAKKYNNYGECYTEDSTQSDLIGFQNNIPCFENIEMAAANANSNSSPSRCSSRSMHATPNHLPSTTQSPLHSNEPNLAANVHYLGMAGSSEVTETLNDNIGLACTTDSRVQVHSSDFSTNATTPVPTDQMSAGVDTNTVVYMEGDNKTYATVDNATMQLNQLLGEFQMPHTQQQQQQQQQIQHQQLLQQQQQQQLHAQQYHQQLQQHPQQHQHHQLLHLNGQPMIATSTIVSGNAMAVPRHLQIPKLATMQPINAQRERQKLQLITLPAGTNVGNARMQLTNANGGMGLSVANAQLNLYTDMGTAQTLRWSATPSDVARAVTPLDAPSAVAAAAATTTTYYISARDLYQSNLISTTTAQAMSVAPPLGTMAMSAIAASSATTLQQPQQVSHEIELEKCSVDANENYIGSIQRQQQQLQQQQQQQQHHQQQQQQIQQHHQQQHHQRQQQQQQPIMIVIPQEFMRPGDATTGCSAPANATQLYTTANNGRGAEHGHALHIGPSMQTVLMPQQQHLLHPQQQHQQQQQHIIQASNVHQQFLTSTPMASPSHRGVHTPSPSPRPLSRQQQPLPLHNISPAATGLVKRPSSRQALTPPIPMRQQQVQPKAQRRNSTTVQEQKVNLVCRFCHKGQKFTSNLDYSNHIIAMHPVETPYNCPHCPMHFTKRVKRQHHIVEEHGNHRFQCAQCGQSFITQRVLDQHLQRSHALESPQKAQSRCQEQQQLQQSQAGHAAMQKQEPQQHNVWRDGNSSGIAGHHTQSTLVCIEDVHLQVKEESSCDTKSIDLQLDNGQFRTEQSTSSRQSGKPQRILCCPDCDDCLKDGGHGKHAQQPQQQQLQQPEREQHYLQQQQQQQPQQQCSQEQQQPQPLKTTAHVTMPSPEQTEPDSTSTTTLRQFRKRRSTSYAKLAANATSTLSSVAAAAVLANAGDATNEEELLLMESQLGNGHNCLFCGAHFTNNIALRKHHQMAHNNQASMPFVCSICNRGYRMRNALQRHMETHDSEGRPYECTLCHVRFPRPSQLTLHKLTVHFLKKPHSCHECGKNFGTESALKTHCKFHGEPEIQCDLCERKYYLMKDLRKHRRIHTGERFYKCDICSSSFVHYTRLSAHIKTHLSMGVYMSEETTQVLTVNEQVYTAEQHHQQQIPQLEQLQLQQEDKVSILELSPDDVVGDSEQLLQDELLLNNAAEDCALAAAASNIISTTSIGSNVSSPVDPNATTTTGIEVTST